MLELPFNLNGRRKNASLELVFALVLTSSSEGKGGGDEGIRLRTLCTNPIDAVVFVVRWGKVRDRGRVFAPGRQSTAQRLVVLQ